MREIKLNEMLFSFGRGRRRLAVLLVLVSTAYAQAGSPAGVDFGRSWGFAGVRGGFIELEDVDEDGSFNLGVFGAYQLFPALALEISLDFQLAEIYVEDEYGSFEVDFIDRETTALQFGFNFSPVERGPFRPFFTAGVGYYYSQYTHQDYDWDGYGWDDHVGEGGFYTGVGADLFGSPVSARGFSFTTEAHWLFTEREDRSDAVRSDGFIVTAGCKYRF